LEIQPVPFDHVKGDFSKTIDEHLEKVGEVGKDCLIEGYPVFVEVQTLYDNDAFDDTTLMVSGEHPVEFVVEAFESQKIPAIPVTGLARDLKFQYAVKSVVDSFGRGVCIRITKDDLLDMETLKKAIKALRDHVGVSKEEVDIVLDFNHIRGTTTKQFASDLLVQLANFPHLNKWRTVTIMATSMPANLSQFSADSANSIARVEWQAYKVLRQLNLSRIPSFGDYNITHPAFLNVDPRVINIGASIKYTTSKEFLIHKGKSIKGNGFDQMINLCKEVISHPEYKGRTFSLGDQYIEDCSKKVASTGNKETWVTVGVNHHLTQVIHDLSILADF